MRVMTALRNRGVKDVLIVCCDGLPRAIASVWFRAVVQNRVSHLIRNSMRCATWKDCRAITAGLRPTHTASTIEAAEIALGAFASRDVGKNSSAVVDAGLRAWTEFVPFLEMAAEIRCVV